MGKRKIINDPIYGLISFDHDILYDLIDHPYFQRLRYIHQMGLSYLVYPGAVHSRFQHALGALHLMTKAIDTLQRKSVVISQAESEAVCIAILLHDIGHGPAIDIFKGKYQKHFLHQLVSSQLDMDRMDYLIRDSFYCGVAEGIVGYDRIINMLNVADGRLVIEEKAIYSVEKFILSRRMMYWQVYLHKTGIVAEQMLLKFVERLKILIKNEAPITEKIPDFIKILLLDEGSHEIKSYLYLTDHEIYYILKLFNSSEDKVARFYSRGIVQRKLLKIILRDFEFSSDYISNFRQKLVNYESQYKDIADQFILSGSESIQAYNHVKDEIMVLSKSGNITPLSKISGILDYGKTMKKYFLCYPDFIV